MRYLCHITLGFFSAFQLLVLILLIRYSPLSCLYGQLFGLLLKSTNAVRFYIIKHKKEPSLKMPLAFKQMGTRTTPCKLILYFMT